jgi:hypothetical protein
MIPGLAPVVGKTITFTLNGNPAGSGITDTNGVATSGTVSLCGATYNATTYPTGAAASFAGDLSFGASSGNNSLTVAKANATVGVTPYTVTYNGNSHTATVTSITGVCGETGATVGTVDVSGTTHVLASGSPYSDTWTFTANPTFNNYNNIAAGPSTTITDTINKANATWTTNPNSKTYGDPDPNPLTTGSGSGFVPADAALVTATYGRASGENVGTYHITATLDPTDVVANYNITNNGADFTINKANATINVTSYNVTYTGTAHTATGTATGVHGESLAGLDLSGTTHTNAGDYPTDPWTFTDATGNYNDDSGTVHDHIDKANATITVTPYHVTYDGNAHTATGTATGANSEDLSSLLDLSGTSHTNAGDYPTDTWGFNIALANGNYNPTSGTVHDIIDKANASITVTPYHVTYDANPHTATGSATGVLGESLTGLDLSGTTHTNAADYPTDPWTFTDVTGNYNNEQRHGSRHHRQDRCDGGGDSLQRDV